MSHAGDGVARTPDLFEGEDVAQQNQVSQVIVNFPDRHVGAAFGFVSVSHAGDEIARTPDLLEKDYVAQNDLR